MNADPDSPQRYYRVHWDGRSATGWRAFAARNAWSRPWGAMAVIDDDGDPARYTCVPCDATGLAVDEESGRCRGGEATWDADRGGWICPDCQGEGSREADRGYSGVGTLAGLFAEYDLPEFGSAAEIVEFEGELAGFGCDGEPLVVPTRVVRWMSFDQAREEC